MISDSAPLKTSCVILVKQVNYEQLVEFWGYLTTRRHSLTSFFQTGSALLNKDLLFGTFVDCCSWIGASGADSSSTFCSFSEWSTETGAISDPLLDFDLFSVSFVIKKNEKNEAAFFLFFSDSKWRPKIFFFQIEIYFCLTDRPFFKFLARKKCAPAGDLE